MLRKDKNMKILSLDPGETIGYALLEVVPDVMKLPWLLDSGEVLVPRLSKIARSPIGFSSGGVDWKAFWQSWSDTLNMFQPDMVVLEDYRIYAETAKMHIGKQLFTAELIGAIELLCSLLYSPPSFPLFEVVRIPAAKKGRWPEARLDAKFSEHKGVKRPHAHDALVLALVYLEGEGLWTP